MGFPLFVANGLLPVQNEEDIQYRLVFINKQPLSSECESHFIVLIFCDISLPQETVSWFSAFRG